MTYAECIIKIFVGVPRREPTIGILLIVLFLRVFLPQKLKFDVLLCIWMRELMRVPLR